QSPRILKVTPNLVTLSSRNWAGYVAGNFGGGTTTTFNRGSANWVEPAITCPQGNDGAVFWGGVDGWFDGTGEPRGSAAYYPGSTLYYYLWWEMSRPNAIQYAGVIAAGDHITASVTYMPASGIYPITATDTTTGLSFATNQTCASVCNRSSAEVIAEDPG